MEEDPFDYERLCDEMNFSPYGAESEKIYKRLIQQAGEQN